MAVAVEQLASTSAGLLTSADAEAPAINGAKLAVLYTGAFGSGM